MPERWRWRSISVAAILLALVTIYQHKLVRVISDVRGGVELAACSDHVIVAFAFSAAEVTIDFTLFKSLMSLNSSVKALMLSKTGK